MDRQPPLEKGQVWRTRAARIEILALGRRLIHYVVTTQLGLKRVSIQLSGIQAMDEYLKANHAELVTSPAEN